MRHLIYVWVFLLSVTSCSFNAPKESSSTTEESTNPAEVKQEVKTKKAPKKTDNTYPKITNDNVVKFLTQYGKEHQETHIRLSCKFGDIDIKLYTNTPLHRANMIYLTKQGYFDLTQFYRVSKNFVDQAGNSDEWECQIKRAEIGGYTLPAEFTPKNIHKYGSIAMARRYDKNPNKRSSPFEFYIVLGHPYNDREMRSHEREFGTKYTDAQKDIFNTIGGVPYLDQQHTVIGEVISGMDVAIELNKVKVDNREWPLNEIPITMKVIR